MQKQVPVIVFMPENPLTELTSNLWFVDTEEE